MFFNSKRATLSFEEQIMKKDKRLSELDLNLSKECEQVKELTKKKEALEGSVEELKNELAEAEQIKKDLNTQVGVTICRAVFKNSKLLWRKITVITYDVKCFSIKCYQ